MKLAFADREAYYGDPAHVDVPIEACCRAAYAADRRALIGDRRLARAAARRIAGYERMVDGACCAA